MAPRTHGTQLRLLRVVFDSAGADPGQPLLPQLASLPISQTTAATLKFSVSLHL